MQLTSTQNPLLQKVRRAVAEGRPLDDGAIAAEGPHLLAEALRSPWQVEHIFYSSESLERHQVLLDQSARQGIPLTEVSTRAFKAVSGTEQDRGIMCLVRPRTFQPKDLFGTGGAVVILDGIQDPGNAGAIVRSIEAFGATGVVFTDGCVRISNGKFLRATSGSLFRVPYLQNMARAQIIEELRSRRQPLFALVAAGQRSLFKTSLRGGFGLTVGSEGGGISALMLNASEGLSIPTRGVESLNAAIACSVALYEAARQRESQIL